MNQVKSYNSNQTYFFHFNPFEYFKPNSLEMTIHNVIEKHIDINPFLILMNNKNKGQKAISPKILLKIIFYAYCNTIFSSRTIKEYLTNNLSFIFLSDHNIIATQLFVDSLLSIQNRYNIFSPKYYIYATKINWLISICLQ